MALVNHQEFDEPPDDYHFYLNAAQNATTSTFSTTATAPNLPGPGRVIGLGYDILGNALVNQIGRLKSRLKKKRPRTDEALHTSEDLVYSSFLPDEADDSSERSASRESFSTTATAPNLPGTGRVLGLLYDALGNKLVNWMTKRALKKGFSPGLVGEDIYEKTYHLRRNNQDQGKSEVVRIEDLNKTDRAKLMKACKKLLKYATKSNVLENQLLALEILCADATVPALRALYMQMDASKELGSLMYRTQKSGYGDTDILLNKSRKALISLSDTNVNKLSDALEDIFNQEEPSFGHANMLLSKILACITDDKLSSLVLLRVALLVEECVFGHYDTATGLFNISSIFDAIEKLVSGPQEYVDWGELDFLFNQWLNSFETRIELRKETSRVVRIICQFPESLPQSVSYLNGQAEMLDLEEYEYILLGPMPVTLWGIVEEELQTFDITEASPEELQLNVLNYNHYDLSYVWSCFLCPATMILRQFLLEQHPLWDRDGGAPTALGRNFGRVLPSERVLDFYRRLLALSLSPDVSTRRRAQRYSKFILKSDKYCWSLLSNVPRQASFIGEEPQALSTEDVLPYIKYGLPTMLYRHRCEYGQHGLRLTTIRACALCSEMAIADADWNVMHIPVSSVLWLDNTLELSNVNIEHSLLEVEQGLYVAGVFLDNNVYWKSVQFCIVEKGAATVEYFDSDTNKRRSRRYHLLVLRHDKRLFLEAGESMLEQFAWKPDLT